MEERKAFCCSVPSSTPCLAEGCPGLLTPEGGIPLCAVYPRGCGTRHTYGVGGGDDGAASLQGGNNAGLGDGDALLLHGLVDAGSVLVIHLHETPTQESCPDCPLG